MNLEQIKPVRIALPESGDRTGGSALRVASGAKPQRKYAHKESGDGHTNIDGTNLNDNSVAARKALAQKQAMRVVSGAYGSEKMMDKNMVGIRAEIRRLGEETNSLKIEQAENEQKLAALREKYGIKEGSEEEKGLQKAVYKVNNPDNPMTNEDYEALSPYQKEALYYASSAFNNAKQLALDEAAVVANKQAHTDLELERLKSHAMTDAQKNAEELIAASEKDAIAQLRAEAVDHIDKEAEEEQEKAAKRKEEEKEAKKEAAKKAEQEAVRQEVIARIRERDDSDGISRANALKQTARREKKDAEQWDVEQVISRQTALAADDMQEQVKVSSEVTNILNKLSLLPEDIKGTSVDGQL